jgi:hypothetical protein
MLPVPSARDLALARNPFLHHKTTRWPSRNTRPCLTLLAHRHVVHVHQLCAVCGVRVFFEQL